MLNYGCLSAVHGPYASSPTADRTFVVYTSYRPKSEMREEGGDGWRLAAFTLRGLLSFTLSECAGCTIAVAPPANLIAIHRMSVNSWLTNPFKGTVDSCMTPRSSFQNPDSLISWPVLSVLKVVVNLLYLPRGHGSVSGLNRLSQLPWYQSVLKTYSKKKSE